MERHPANLFSLLFGLFFTVVGLVLLSGGVEAVSMAWAGPLVAIGLGGLLLLAARSSRSRHADEPPPES